MSYAICMLWLVLARIVRDVLGRRSPRSLPASKWELLCPSCAAASAPFPPPSRPAPSRCPGPEGQQWWTASELRLALGDDRAVYYLDIRQPLTSTVEGHGYENRLEFLAHAVYRKNRRCATISGRSWSPGVVFYFCPPRRFNALMALPDDVVRRVR